MTNQTAFNRAVRALRLQGKQSMSRGQCLYRGPNALKCAIGHLISDRVYRKEMENRTPYNLCEEFPSMHRLFQGCDLAFLAELQVVHDQNAPEIWEQRWEHVALRWNLTMPRKPVSRTKKKS